MTTNSSTARWFAGVVMAAGLGAVVVGGAVASADTTAVVHGGGSQDSTTSNIGPTAIARKAGKGPVEYLPVNIPPPTPSTTSTPTAQPTQPK
jgi:hypothetical protein